ncbi:hypothetical protein ASG92_14075 [Arthrobacter sp. Soil736]|uniref:ATP-binding protein n=1 Tax=Arthrobacter sp. Soil736 TaxID=1736395 RepID=UPI0006FBAF9D|nr:SbcC/MukB-like Walker B domain-containing protein [Arthrobacter sp. Soil736]KRE67756.1 hypothetical protein ASG92_14075 [Arthrobacter sp. Soil736]
MSETSPATPEVTAPVAPGQWRLAEVQLANWGTFDGAIYRVPIARKGHLMTGPSGSGKSSLLDAIAAVPTPDKWLRLNQAAQGDGTRADQRTIVSYVRGAWSRTTDENEDRVVSAYLRPGATWSGIVLRYENGVDRPVSLCRLFFLRGTAMASADIADLCLLERSAVDLRDLEPFTRSGIETRKVQANWPDAVVTSNRSHGRFYARMRSLFGIAHESALQLLHKTQSAKSIDSLDQLFRDYMLERPATYDLADTAVAQFGELRDAHEHVVQLRQRRDHLTELRAHSDAYDRANNAADAARSMADSVVPYQKHQSLRLALAEHGAVGEQLVSLRADAERADGSYRRADEDADLAQRRALELGGDEAEHLQHRIRTAQDAERATRQRWDALECQLTEAGVAHTPTTAAEFAELMAEIDRTLQSPSTSTGPSHAQQERFFIARAAKDRIETAIRTLRMSGTTVPDNLIGIRRAISTETGLPVTALPFAAEIIEVRPTFAEWTGAIERVLRPFALTMLVRSEHLPAVRRWAEAHRVNARLVFEEVSSEIPPPRPARSSLSLVNRISVAPGPFAEWVAGQLSERFDYACVDSPDELDDHTRAVTVNGQVKSSRTRYEKDDRVKIDERGYWVLGDRESKLEALIEQLRGAEREYSQAETDVDRAEKERNSDLERRATLKAVRGQMWHDIDRDAAAAAIADLQRRLNDLTREDGGLRDAVGAAQTAREARETAAKALQDAELSLRQATAKHEELGTAIRDLEEAIATGGVQDLDEHTTAALGRRFREVQRSITRQNIAEVGQEVIRRLQQQRDKDLEAARTSGNDVARLAAQFNERWSAAAAAADLSPTTADRRAYLEVLDSIVAHGLPEHESNFLRLLRERSRDMIGELVSDILGAPREIEERVAPVNASLKRSEFDEGRYLKLRVKVRRSETVTRFIADLRSISEGGWADNDLESAEERFATLADIMRRFASSDHVDRSWKRQCLDTRQHVTFLAEEIDAHGRVHATYDSGAAMSGGQQQKLVIFCLAAALRYQLADPDDEFPRYGTIVLDEAFDKADTRYTRMALDIFVEFGFQLILATPQKLLQTIEPYVGAATSIENPTRRRTAIANVPWRQDAASDVTTAGNADGEATSEAAQ